MRDPFCKNEPVEPDIERMVAKLQNINLPKIHNVRATNGRRKIVSEAEKEDS